MVQWLPWGTAVLLALLGAWVYGARPKETANRALALALLLFAGSTVAFATFRTTADPTTSQDLLRLIFWLELPALLLVALAFERLFLPAPRTPWRRRGLVAGFGVLVALLVTLLAWPGLWFYGPARGPPGFWSVKLHHLYGVLSYAVTGLAVVAGGLVAADAAREPLERRQAAAVGIAFAALASNQGGGLLLAALFGTIGGTLGALLVRATGLLGLAAVVFAAPRLADAFDAGGRRLAWLALALPFVGGVVDVSRHTILPALGLQLPFTYRNTRTFWLALFAIGITLAVTRYGMAGVKREARDRMARIGTLVLLGGAALAPAVWIHTASSAGAPAKAGLGLLLAAGLGVLYRPVRVLQADLLDHVVADPEDTGVLRAKHRAYKATLSSIRASEASIGDHRQLLEGLRDRLGITVQDHLLLSSEVGEGGSRGRLLLNRYAVEAPLGSQARRTTYLARDARTARRVVVKRIHGPDEGAGMDPRVLDRWSRIDHEHVRSLERAEPIDRGWILVLDYVPGRSLDVHLEAGGLSEDDAARVVLDVLAGLAALHEAGLVHGDLKPSNVLLPEGGPAVVADLGSAVLADHDPTDTRAVRSTGGTLATMAPEELGGGPPTPASDVYAAGALLHRLLTGRHYLPLEGVEASRARERVRRKPPDLEHPDLPEEARPLLRRALAKDPSDRFPSALAFASAIQETWAPVPREAGYQAPDRSGLGDLEDQP